MASRRSADPLVAPANNKWFTRLVVAASIIDTLSGMKPKFPEVGAVKLRQLAAARRKLRRGK